MTYKSWILALLGMGALAACGGGDGAKDPGEAEPMLSDAYPSTYAAYPSQPTLITGATIYTGTGELIEDGSIFLRDGKIELIGPAGEVNAPKGDIVEIEAGGKFVTPGIIDNHSHLGVYPSPGFRSTSDGNEATSPNTAQVWAEHSVWPQDAGFTRALAGGVTSLMILPGSANLFGGRTVVLKNVPSRTVQGMKFPDAPHGIKMACGENPKRVYGSSGPSTRMGNFAGYRAAFLEAEKYKEKWDDYLADPDSGEVPDRDLKMETLAGVLAGDILVNIHCYRADELAFMMDLADEFDFDITAFHHVVEGYKVADMLGEREICASVWADWWGFKLEAYDAVRENAALIHAAPGGCTIIHSDSDIGIQRLNQEMAKAWADGVKFGIDIPKEEAIKWITANPARAMGILDQTGTLEVGKMADVVIWDEDPFSVYAKAEQVFIDGALMFDRNDPAISPRMDFEIGQQANETTGGAGQ